MVFSIWTICLNCLIVWIRRRRQKSLYPFFLKKKKKLLNSQVGFGAFHCMTLACLWAADSIVHLFQTSFPLPCSCRLLCTALQWCWRQASTINPLGFHRIQTRQNMSFSWAKTGPCLLPLLSPHHTPQLIREEKPQDWWTGFSRS